MSSGAHLHFEVWQNRETVDPLRLWISPIFDLNHYPISINIVYRRPENPIWIYGKMLQYDSFTLHGNEIERQKYLLDTYAVGVI